MVKSMNLNETNNGKWLKCFATVFSTRRFIVSQYSVIHSVRATSISNWKVCCCIMNMMSICVLLETSVMSVNMRTMNKTAIWYFHNWLQYHVSPQTADVIMRYKLSISDYVYGKCSFIIFVFLYVSNVVPINHRIWIFQHIICKYICSYHLTMNPYELICQPRNRLLYGES